MNNPLCNHSPLTLYRLVDLLNSPILGLIIMSYSQQSTKARPATMAHSYRLGLVIWRYPVRIPVGPDVCYRGCVYTVLQTVERLGVYSAAYVTVHYKEPLKSFEVRVGHSPGFGFLLSRYCHDCAESDVKQYSYIYSTNAKQPV